MVDIQNRGVPATDMVMHAPANPAQVFCTIGNYRDQILEAARDAEDGPGGPGAPRRVAEATAMIERRVLEGRPYVCSKGHQCVASSGGALEVPGEMRTLDWEVELGVIIGRTAWQIDVGEALDYVAGYCVVNDITLRERIFRNDPKVMGTDWIESKARPGWLPVGPWLVPSWDVHDPQDLRLSLRLNGEVMQNGWTGDMLFGVAEQIAYLAQHTRLEPGDLICTGSPSGFGSHHQRFLQSGDLIEATVEGLGVQRVRCI
ncbi:fumarylacetoacetate hydrolase family protein [Caballeronia sp. J97]|uniref:fumarylacetoacetate hydrolase family protein n=1 Tax=Caballeronia sp. J97 TaxID=2805429 RepID=UPI002AAFA479|nr:fumarylacetoacetate hydrolase family protein [Caballeronia sp. J97]